MFDENTFASRNDDDGRILTLFRQWVAARGAICAGLGSDDDEFSGWSAERPRSGMRRWRYPRPECSALPSKPTYAATAS